MIYSIEVFIIILILQMLILRAFKDSLVIW